MRDFLKSKSGRQGIFCFATFVEGDSMLSMLWTEASDTVVGDGMYSIAITYSSISIDRKVDRVPKGLY